MDWFTIVTGTILLGLAGYLAVRLTWVIVRNLIQGTWLRRRLGRELSELPMSRALQRAGLDAAGYLPVAFDIASLLQDVQVVGHYRG